MCFQTWAEQRKGWTRLVLGILLYICSFLTYEAASFLIFAIPLLVFPVHQLKGGKWLEKRFLFALGLALATGFGLALTIRFTLLDGGAISHHSFFPPLKLVFAYILLLPLYLIEPFRDFHADAGIIALVIMFGICLAIWLIKLRRQTGTARPLDDLPSLQRPLYILAAGFCIFMLGMAPYQIAGYGCGSPSIMDTVLFKYGLSLNSDCRWFNFNEASRIYSSASFGVAVLIAGAMTLSKRKILSSISLGAGLTALACMVVFHAGLRVDWQEAAEIRSDLLRSLISQVPEVRWKTNLVFLDLETYHKRAAVVRGWAGLRELMRILYDDRSLGAWYVYTPSKNLSDAELQKAIVLPGGFVSRGMSLKKPAPHDSLLVLKRQGRELVLVDELSSRDSQVSKGISWRDANKLASNINRITAYSESELLHSDGMFAKVDRKSSLISWLHLNKARLALRFLNNRAYWLSKSQLKHLVLKKIGIGFPH